MPLPTREEVRQAALEAKLQKKVTWAQLAEMMQRSPVFVAMLVYGYERASNDEADALCKLLGLPDDYKSTMMRVPMREPIQTVPPTDPFIYRMYENVILYGPVYKDVAHELFEPQSDGILSAIDQIVDIQKVETDKGSRCKMTFNAKWLPFPHY